MRNVTKRPLQPPKPPKPIDLKRLGKAESISPLQVLLHVTRAKWGAGDQDAATAVAAIAAPYVHPWLAAVEQKTETTIEHHVISAEPISSADWLKKFGRPTAPLLAHDGDDDKHEPGEVH